eukprot:06112.XXX_327841_327966_1 [CDS] Oithona nana genome sequencing.
MTSGSSNVSKNPKGVSISSSYPSWSIWQCPSRGDWFGSFKL